MVFSCNVLNCPLTDPHPMGIFAYHRLQPMITKQDGTMIRSLSSIDVFLTHIGRVNKFLLSLASFFSVHVLLFSISPKNIFYVVLFDLVSRHPAKLGQICLRLVMYCRLTKLYKNYEVTRPTWQLQHTFITAMHCGS